MATAVCSHEWSRKLGDTPKDRRTDGQADMTKLIAVLRSFANARKKHTDIQDWSHEPCHSLSLRIYVYGPILCCERDAAHVSIQHLNMKASHA